VDSHTKQAELSESYQLAPQGGKSGCGLPPAKRRLAAACGKPNALLAPTCGWVKSPFDQLLLTAPDGTLHCGEMRQFIFPAFFSSSAEPSKSVQICLESPWWGRGFPCPEEGHTAPYSGAHGVFLAR